MRLLPRSALLAVLMPLLYLATASAAFLFRVHADNRDGGTAVLRDAEGPRAGDRIVIVSPHPDDETLSCAGLMAQARRAGAAVDVVFLTNGDGFRFAVQRQYRTVRVTPDDFLRFAALRQEETRRALAVVGVTPDHAHFLGFPDSGLMELWTRHWQPDTPFVSPFTKRDRPLGLGAGDATVYCGRDVERDLAAVLNRLQPTQVYVTHPSDDHNDHTAASAFATRALWRLQDEGAEWARGCRLYYYLVHRGDWPSPSGLHREKRLPPPAEMVGLDSRWSLLQLSPADVALKAKAIGQYASQLAMMRSFLLSFARDTEPRAEAASVEMPHVPDGRVLPDAKALDWNGLSPIARDPVNDNLLREYQRGGDIAAIWACMDGGNLYLRVDTYRPMTAAVAMRVQVRLFGADGSLEGTRFMPVRLGANGESLTRGVLAVRSGTITELAIPIARLHGASQMAVNVETHFAGLLVDRTGYRFARLR